MIFEMCIARAFDCDSAKIHGGAAAWLTGEDDRRIAPPSGSYARVLPMCYPRMCLLVQSIGYASFDLPCVLFD